MSVINNNLQGAGSGLGIDEAVTRAVNLSDAAQMENNFISLMVAQIQNQDPTNPVESDAFLQQYSAMSQVKSLENMASMTQSNLVLLDNLQTLTAAGLVGQTVKVAAEQLQVSDQVISGDINLEHAANQLNLVLTDAYGVRREVNLGAQAPGRVAFSFDPKELGLMPGQYQVAVSSDSGEYPNVEVAGRVTQVRVSAEGPVLEVEGIGSAPFYTITEFGRSPVAGLL